MRIQQIFLLHRKIAGNRNFLYPGHPFNICPTTSKITTGIRANEFSCTRKWVAPLTTQPRRTSLLHWSQTSNFSTSRDDEDNDDEPDLSYFHGCFFDGHIPKKEIQTKMTRGGGPGGMNVNANSTKAEIYFNLNKAHWIPGKVRERMHQKYGGFIDREGVLRITSMRSRSGSDNFEDCFEKLRDMLDVTSLQLVKERRREYISPEHQQEVERRKERAEEFRLASKKRSSEKKKNRRQIN